MAEIVIARRYAGALMELAREEDAALVDTLNDDLNTAVQVLRLGDNQLLHALCHPGITLAERKGVLNAVLALEKLSLHAFVANILRLMLDKGRFGLVPNMAEAYQELADAHAGRIRALVTTARPLDAALAAEVKAALENSTGKTIIMQTEVDPSLIGGMVAKVDTKVYDASMRSQLHKLKTQLLNAGQA